MQRKCKVAGLPVEDKLLAPEALEMDKDANSNNDPKGPLSLSKGFFQNPFGSTKSKDSCMVHPINLQYH